MRLLLDEQLDRAIAEDLRRRGYDVVAVTERADLRGLSDTALLDLADGDDRAIATRNVRHFLPLAEERVATGGQFAGLILIPGRRFSPAERTHGQLVRALAAILDEHPTRTSLRGRILWLTEPAAEPDER